MNQSIRMKHFYRETDWDEDDRYYTLEYFPEINELVEKTIYGWPTIHGRREEVERVEATTNPSLSEIFDRLRFY